LIISASFCYHWLWPDVPCATYRFTEAERGELKRLARRPKSAQALAQRASILLRCAEGLSNNEVADRLGIASATVGKWRSRFRHERLQGLSDAPRSGPPRKIGDDVIEAVVAKTLTSRPKGSTHWSTRELAAETGLSQSTIVRVWHTFGLQPHRSEKFKLSTDPLFIEKTRDIVGLYMSPPENALVLCVDEKSQVQALDRTQPIFPMRPGVPERQSHDYLRHGATSLFAAFNVQTGKVIGSCHRRHRHQEFLKFLRRVDVETAGEQDVHLVLDNYATHKLLRSSVGSLAIRAFTFTSRPRVRVGSTKSNDSSQRLRADEFGAERSRASQISKMRSASTSSITTSRRSRSPGQPRRMPPIYIARRVTAVVRVAFVSIATVAPIVSTNSVISSISDSDVTTSDGACDVAIRATCASLPGSEILHSR